VRIFEFGPHGKRISVTLPPFRLRTEWSYDCPRDIESDLPKLRRGSPARWCVTLGGSGASVIHDLTTGRASAGNIEIIGIVGATFSADGKLLAAASHHGFARIWDTATLRPMGDFRGFLQGVSSVAFSPDSRRLVTGSDGREAIKFWDVESHEELLTLEGEGSWFNVTAFSADGAVLGSMNASDSKRSILHLWRAPSWEEIEAAEKASQRDNRK